MPVRRDPRTARWFFRATVKRPDGTRARIFGTPGTPGPFQDLAPTKVGAQEAERRAIAEVMTGKPAARPGPTRTEVPTIKEYAERFLANYAASHKPSERRSKTWILGARLVPTFGHLRLDELRQEHVDQYVATELGKGCARKTIGNRIAVLSTLVKYAARNRIIENPELRFSIGGKPGKIEAVAMADVDKLVAAAEPTLRAAILLAAEAGLRAGEIRGLQWGDIRDGQLTVRRALDTDTGEAIAPKHDKVRDVPLSPRLVAALHALPRRALWVVCRPDGRPLDHRRDLYLPLLALYASSGAARPRSPVHALRHSFGTTMAARGTPLPVLARLMGHSQIAVTMRYIDVDEQQKRDAIAAVFGGRGSDVAAETTKPGNL